MGSRWLFVTGVLIPLIIDEAVTLIGQPALYWQNHNLFLEASPFTLLSFGPAAAVLGSLVYAVIMALLLWKLPIKISLPLGLLAFVGHAWGGSGWFPDLMMRYGISQLSWYAASLIYFLVISVILSAGILKWFKPQK